MSLGFLFAAALGALLQNAPDSTVARVEGSVINQVTKEPVDRVEVRFTPETGSSQVVSTDAEGKFAIRALPAGRYRLKLTRSGFADPELNAGPRHLTLQPDSELKGIRMELVATSAISGRVLNQNRQPVEAAIVHALKVQYVNGRRLLSPGGFASTRVYLPLVPFDTYAPSDSSVFPPQAKANAMGEYRLFGLPPGEYYLAIWSKGPNPQVDEAPIYYPGVTDPSLAIPVVVRGGSPEMPGMDIQIPEIRGYSAQLRFIPPTGEGYDCGLGLPQLKAFTLVQHSTNLDVVHYSGYDVEAGNDRVTKMRLRKTGDNTWTTSMLPPGSYEMFHSSCAGSGAGLSAQLSFNIVNRDIDAGTAAVSPTVRVSGRVRNTTGAVVQLGSLVIRMRPVDWRGFFPGSAPNTTPDGYNQVRSDGTFAFEWFWNAGMVFGRVAPGHFMVDLGGLPPDVYVSSIKYGAKEVRDSGMVVDSGPPGEIEITLGSPGATVNGTVRNSRDERVPDSAVVLVPQSGLDAPVSLSRTAMTDQQGTFSLRGIPPGTYWVLAPDGSDVNAFDNPEFFKQYQNRSTRVVLENASAVDLNLRVIAR